MGEIQDERTNLPVHCKWCLGSHFNFYQKFCFDDFVDKMKDQDVRSENDFGPVI